MELCFLTNVSGEVWAAWGQAVISGLAILGSFFLARRFQKDELQRFEIQHLRQIELQNKIQQDADRRLANVEHDRQIHFLRIALDMLRHLRKTCVAFSKDTSYEALLCKMVEETVENALIAIDQIPIFQLPSGDFATELFRCRNGCRGYAHILAQHEGVTMVAALHRIRKQADEAISVGDRLETELIEAHRVASA